MDHLIESRHQFGDALDHLLLGLWVVREHQREHGETEHEQRWDRQERPVRQRARVDAELVVSHAVAREREHGADAGGRHHGLTVASRGPREPPLTFPLGQGLGSLAMEERLTIGAFARLTGLTPKALRHYDALGLLHPAAVERNGYRLYDRGQVETGRLIRRLRDLDVPLEEIRVVLDDPAQAGKRLEAFTRELEADLFRRQRNLHQLRNLSDPREGAMTETTGTRRAC